MAESFLQQQLKLFSDNQSGPKFTLIYGNRLKGYQVFYSPIQQLLCKRK